MRRAPRPLLGGARRLRRERGALGGGVAVRRAVRAGERGRLEVAVLLDAVDRVEVEVEHDLAQAKHEKTQLVSANTGLEQKNKLIEHKLNAKDHELKQISECYKEKAVRREPPPDPPKAVQPPSNGRPKKKMAKQTAPL